jgi:hypothetical protein
MTERAVEAGPRSERGCALCGVVVVVEQEQGHVVTVRGRWQGDIGGGP